MIFLVYIDTLDPVTHKVIRSVPLGWVDRSRARDAWEEARRRFSCHCTQVIVLERATGSAITKVTRRQATAVKRGANASFAACYEAMMMSRKVVRAEFSRHRVVQGSMDAMLPGL